MKGAVIDLDGTVYRSEQLVPGAREGITMLRKAGVDVAFVSNTATKSRETCLKRLTGLGIDATRRDVITSASVTARHVSENYPDANTMAIGQPALVEELSRAGATLVEEPSDTDVLVVGKDRSFGYDTLTRGLHALENDAAFVATNRDGKSPTDDGNEPGSGAVVAAVAAAAGREPDVVAGKPHDPIVEATFDRLALDPSECFVVGDNPDMDVALGERAGMTTVLVLTGVTGRDDPAVREKRADHVVERLTDLEALLDGGDR